MIIVVIIFAGNILIGKAINDLPPFTIAFFRLLIAFLIVFPLGWRRAWENRAIFLEYKKPFLLMTLAGVTFFNTFIYGALQFTTSSNVAILETVIPALTVVLSALILKEKLMRIQWFGVCLSLLGAIWVVMDGRIFSLLSMDWNPGDAIMIGAIISWSVYSIMVKKYMHLFPAFAALLVMTGISVIVLLPIVLVEWLITGIPSFDQPNLILGLLYLGIFPSLIALVLFNRAVAMLGASQASMFLNFLPVVTIIGAYFWLGENISMMQILGAIIVIAGVTITTQMGKQHTRKTLKENY
ncbi:EamA family transporter [Salipaludibacillus neizhouensis]|uniref:EamA family transporter n=1 Tax=Salipaludibacillus neizhouensis TaxID=885475 RepID=A0A3A9K8N8_9BACI|nr:DMT family transporter [Salipaludibacillus neizhouensis]RKL67878.1 EamA family transporter [Salipaludibacillus neizhouensis]